MDRPLDVQYVVFELADELYALDISSVYEIIKIKRITAVYSSRPFLEGVINLRGKIVPVVNLQRRLDLKTCNPERWTRIVILKSGDEMVGVTVDKVRYVAKFTDIQPPTETVAGVDGSYFDGLGLGEEGVVGILRVEKVLYE